MSASFRLSLFVLLLAVAVGLGAALGQLVGPIVTDPSPVEHSS